jgi:siroheme synthase-like protein
MPAAYPILLDVSDKLAVVVGGGAVAARKVSALLEAGATRVRVVSSAFHESLPQSPHVLRIESRYEPWHLDHAAMVYACTDRRDVNEQVVKDAKARGIWVNRADTDDAYPGDFVTPATRRVGPITITANAGGLPPLAARVADAAAAAVDSRWAALATAMQSLRPWIRDGAGLSPHERAELFRSLYDDETLDAALRGEDALKAALLRRFPKLAGG